MSLRTFWREITHNKLNIVMMAVGIGFMPEGPWWREFIALGFIVVSAVRWAWWLHEN